VPQHLQTNRTAQAALAGRHRVQLSAAAAELLMRFLHSARLALLLALVNEYLEVSVRDMRSLLMVSAAMLRTMLWSLQLSWLSVGGLRAVSAAWLRSAARLLWSRL